MDDLEFLSQNLEQFKKQNISFMECLPKLQDALKMALQVPVTSETDHFVLVLSKLCVDRLQDIFILCSQNRGDGTMPLVRAMFEGLVNACYISAHPEKSEDFKRYALIFIKKVQGQTETLTGRTANPKIKKSIEDALSKYVDADGKLSVPQHDWTKVNLIDRAKDVGLGHAVVDAYYKTIEVAHPSMIHAHSQSKRVGKINYIFRGADEFNKQKIKEALFISHYLAIEVLCLLHRTFKNDVLCTYIEECNEGFRGLCSEALSDL